jgi:hypothetical protein
MTSLQSAISDLKFGVGSMLPRRRGFGDSGAKVEHLEIQLAADRQIKRLTAERASFRDARRLYWLQNLPRYSPDPFEISDERDLPAVGRKDWTSFAGWGVGNVPLIAAVRIHHIDFLPAGRCGSRRRQSCRSTRRSSARKHGRTLARRARPTNTLR